MVCVFIDSRRLRCIYFFLAIVKSYQIENICDHDANIDESFLNKKLEDDDEIHTISNILMCWQLLEAGDWRLKCDEIGKHAAEAVRS